MREKPISSVPRAALCLLALSLACQFGWHANRPNAAASAEDLPPPPPLSALRIASLGEPIALGKVLMLYLQSFDNQPGIQIPFRKLNFDQMQGWLDRVLQLDPPGQYPLLLASRVYGEVADEAKQRQMLEFVYQKFLEDPNRRWPWLAHAVVIARHKLKDMPLARKYAQAIRIHATSKDVPHIWKQMEIFILESMDELETAKVLIGGLLYSGQITDEHEMRFLEERLAEMAAKAKQK